MRRKLILFGAGDYGVASYNALKNNHEIIFFCDNKKAIQGKTLFGIPIISPEDMNKYIDSDTDIIISSSSYLEIGKQLDDMNINNYFIGYDGTVFNKPEERKNNRIRRCTRCVMDNTSDNTIFFDENGHCNYCTSAINNIGRVYFPNVEGKKLLEKMLDKVKDEGKDKKYDCIMGLSGGLDSSYLVYLGYKWGLRILVVHVDDGFDSDISKANIERLIEKTRYDYESIYLDNEQYADLVVSYMKAGVPNIAVPQDNCDLAFIYDVMYKYQIKYFLSGDNFALECILQKGNSYSNLDVDNIRNIHRRFGTKPIDKLRFISSDQKRQIKEEVGIEILKPLDLIDYNKDRAYEELKKFCDYEYYGGKHLENTLTEFIQLYWFPKKFNVDKRTSHLSSLIVSGQLTREGALEELEKPLYDEKEMKRCIGIVKKGLHLSDDEFEVIMNGNTHRHEDYNT